MKKKRIILTLILLAITFFQANNRVKASRPNTIPALKEWTDGTGEFNFSSNSRIVVNPQSYEKLLVTAQLFKEDILALKGVNVEIVSEDSPKSGDINIAINSIDSALGKEGYSLQISNNINIQASSVAGVFYGTRSVLQLLKDKNNINGGSARDWPDYPERGMMIDNGRKYFTMDWLENQMKEMAYIKLNYLHFHITENDGFRLECKSHPNFTSTEFYSNIEIKKLQDMALKYHITIVPEINMPGHVWSMLKFYIPEMMLKDTNDCYYNAYFDITKDTTLKLIKEILDEFFPLFTGPYWHLGADEYQYKDFERYPQFLKYAQSHYGANAIASDTYLGFINWVDSIAHTYGKTLRIWNDGMSKCNTGKNVVKLNKGIIVEYWEGDDHPKDIIDSGYNIMNCSSDFFYYNIGTGWRVYNNYLYELWQPEYFQGNKTVGKNNPKNLGSKLQIWCNFPTHETEGHIANTIRLPLKIIAQGLWASPKLVPTLVEFENIADSIGMAPGVSYPENPMPNNLVFKKRLLHHLLKKGQII